MPKQKASNTQVISKSNKEDQNIHLPPGLINHGNTCFMNSVLQGLIASSYMRDLFQFQPLPPAIQQSVAIPIASRRSPLLTNGHGVGGPDEKAWEEGMPIGDIFVTLMEKAWAIQDKRTEENISPRQILTALGQKYDQYLDFRQQDAHELLRHLIDAMCMEEMDIIKKRQPPPAKNKKQKRRSTMPSISGLPPQPSPLAAVMNHSLTSSAYPDEAKLLPFTDMLFGGKLTSVLVCQTCKRVSHTYEGFNDLSLSIKPEDYARERKRDRLMNLAKKFKNLHGTALSVGLGGVELQRSSSVPPSPRVNVDASYLGDPPIEEPRRRSLDYSDHSGVRQTYVNVSADNSKEGTETETGTKGEHVEFSEPLKIEKRDKKRKEDDGWSGLGRRISVRVGLTKDGDSGRSRSTEKVRGRRSMDRSGRTSEDGGSNSANPITPLPQHSHEAYINTSPLSQPRLEPNRRKDDYYPSPSASPGVYASNSTSTSPTVPAPRVQPLPSPAANPSLGIERNNSPLPPKPTGEEAAYLHQILADIAPTSPNPFGLFKTPGLPSGNISTATNMLLRMGQMSGIEECLRLFTAVEVLDGDNMLGCRRCWKIANGTYRPKPRPEGNCEDSESDESEKGDEAPNPPISLQKLPNAGPDDEYSSPPSSPSSPSGPNSISSSIASLDSQSLETYETPQSSLPDETPNNWLPASKVLALPSPLDLEDGTHDLLGSLEPHLSLYGGMPIPLISMTAPESPLISPPLTVIAPSSVSTPSFADHSGLALALAAPLPMKDSLRAPRIARHRRIPSDTDNTAESAEESSEESDETSMFSDSSSITSAGISPIASPNISSERLPPPVITKSSGSRPIAVSPKIPRSKQVIMRSAFKRYLIATPPPILVIHLKRFQQVSKAPLMSMSFSGGFKKLEDVVAFPENLDITPFLAPKKEDFVLGKGGKLKLASKKNQRCMYRLYAVVVHIGNMLGGHYIAYTALPFNSSVEADTRSVANADKSALRKWAYISDTVVRLASLDEVLKAKAYICMYERI